MKIEDETQASEALEAVLEWAKAEPETHHGGSSTGITYQRGHIIATRVMPEQTVGVSTYVTVKDAREKAKDMERGYRNWMALSRARIT